MAGEMTAYIYITIGVGTVCAIALVWLLVRRAAGRAARADEPPPSLAPRQTHLTVVYTNLTDFSDAFVRLGDVQAAELLSEYLDAVTPVVRRHGGFLAQIAFDTLFCLFGPILGGRGPVNHAAAAVAAVLDMQAAVDALNERLATRGEPPLTMRAGVASGTAYVGDIGGPVHADFTALGPAVDAAKRLERACKQTPTRNLVNAEARERARHGFTFRDVVAPLDGSAAAPPATFEAVCRLTPDK
jgi:class 3 adenylate cyclase